MLKLSKSKIDRLVFNNKEFYLKRDDLLDKNFSGNKARKLQYFLTDNKNHYKQIVSYGSTQSNAMYSISVLAKKIDIPFVYYSHRVPSFLKNNPIGNYKKSLENGMVIKKLDFNDTQFINLSKNRDVLFLKEGAMSPHAEFGIKILAEEITHWCRQNSVEANIFLPSGTGATSFYLQKHTPHDVFTVALVADRRYLLDEYKKFDTIKKIPTIINPSKKYHFGKLYDEFYDVYKQLLKETNIEFDLLYDSLGISTMLENYEALTNNKKLIYIHQGGILGNISMLERYKYKNQK
jgi:1-aminocyclopropane-1-carboxylate deaminase/D-cysteine desulfhydrase-like pyridoxal-dependent ACC family enzyme